MNIDVEEAFKLADAFTSSQGGVSAAIRYGVGEMIEFNDFFYFDFTLIDDVITPSTDVQFGGAPGSTIDKFTGGAKIIRWHELNSLKKRQNNI